MKKITIPFIALALTTQLTSASVIGIDVTVTNTLQDDDITGGGVLSIFDSETETVGTGTEFPLFVGFFDIDISANSLEMTLINSDNADTKLFPDHRFDTYFYAFDSFNVTSVSFEGLAEFNENATVGLVPAGTVLATLNLSATGVAPLTTTMDTDGFFVRFEEGTDYANIGDRAMVNFSGNAIPEPSTCLLVALGGLTLLRRKR